MHAAVVRPVAAALLVLPLVLGCSTDSSPEEERAELAASLAVDLQDETDGALDADQATCVAEALVETVGVERFEDLVAEAAEQDAASIAPSDDADLRTQVIDVFASCDALDAVLGLTEP